MICGDVINFFVKFDIENCLEDIVFLNLGCIILIVFVSMMMDIVLGKIKEEILEFVIIFFEMV